MSYQPSSAPTPPFGWRGRVGVLVPPGNTTVEPELTAMLPGGISLHAARLPGRVEQDTSVGLRDRFLGYNATLATTSDSYGGFVLDALAYACTGASYLVGPSGEDALLEAMRSGGVERVITAALAVHEALTACHVDRIAIVSPYPEWLTDEAVRYWQARGREVTDVVRVADVVSIYEITDAEVREAASKLDLSRADAVVLSGTGMATIGSIGELGHSFGRPVVSSASAVAWWATKSIAPDAITESATVDQLEQWTR